MTASKLHRLLAAAVVAALASAARPAAAQTRSTQAAAHLPTVDISGTYQAKSKPAQIKGKEAVSTIVIRNDSSASYGKEIVRWRLQPAKGTVQLALGGEWVTYDYKLKGDQLTLSGGDLQKPVTLKRVGPPAPRPASVQVPPDPDTEDQ